MTEGNDAATITLGDDVVTMRRKGSSAVTVAKVLGVLEKGKAKSYYLDRLIHKPSETALDTFTVYGATTSILVQTMHA